MEQEVYHKVYHRRIVNFFSYWFICVKKCFAQIAEYLPAAITTRHSVLEQILLLQSGTIGNSTHVRRQCYEILLYWYAMVHPFG